MKEQLISPRFAVAVAALLLCAPLCRAATPAPDWITEGNQVFANYGLWVATAGDVNGDGYADVIVGASGYDNVQLGEGWAFLYLGSASGLSTTPAWTAESDVASAFFGTSVATAGDVNGDGYDDVIVGASNLANGQSSEGRAYVFLGSPSGLATTAAWTVESNQASAALGRAVSSAGDVNGDGYDDVIVGVPLYDNGQTDEGRAYVYLGSASGLSTTPAWSAEGNQLRAEFGHAVGTAGDVNGDGYSDVIVGARNYDNGQTDEGRAYIYLGSASGLSTTAAWTAESDVASAFFGETVATAGDVNGDGFSDVIVGASQFDSLHKGRVFVYFGSASGPATTASWIADGDQASAQFGFSVSTAGDVNADGYSDVIVGAVSYSNGETFEGRAYVYLGSASGLAATAVWTAESDLASANLGWNVGSAGDVNGDGRSDVIVGAPFYSNGEDSEGAAYAYLGPLVENPVVLGGTVTGLATQKVTCQDQTTGQSVVDRTSDTTWDCEALGLGVSQADRVQTTAKGIATGTVGGSVTRMTPSRVFCQNLTTHQIVNARTSGTSWDCGAMGLVVMPGDSVMTGALGTAD